MAAQRGTALQIRYNAGTDEEPVWAVLGGLRARSFRKGRATIDTTTGDSEDLARTLLEGGGVFTMSVTGDGLFESTAAQEAFNEAADSGDLINLEVIVVGIGAYTGQFQVSEFSMNGPHDDALGFSCSLESADATTLNTMSWALDATLAIDFMNNDAIEAGEYVGAISAVTGLSFSRASAAYAQDVAGVWQPFASGEMRRTARGILLEGARTNSIRNNSMQGVAAGSPGTLPTNWSVEGLSGLTRTVVGSGVSNNIEYVDVRFQGTTADTSGALLFESPGQIAAANGQTWTGAFFAALASGTLTAITYIGVAMTGRNSGLSAVETLGGSSIKASITSSLQRFTHTATFSNATVASTGCKVSLIYPSATAVDFTLRIGWPQLELGASASSPIRTTTAAVTRAADVLSVAVTGAAYPVSLFAEMEFRQAYAAARKAIQADAGSAANLAALGVNASTVALADVVASSVSQASITHGSALGIATHRLAMRADTNDANVSVAGANGTADTSVTAPTAPTTIRLGGGATSGQELFGYLRRAAFIERALTNTELNGMTAA